MSKTKKYVLAGLGLLLLLGVFVFDRPQVAAQATKPPQQVQVMNAAGVAPGQNVPISGNVGISGTPSVNAAQSGAWTVGVTGTPTVAQSGSWNVGINGTPTVTVGNLAAAPVPVRDVDNGARSPVLVQGPLLGLLDGQTVRGETLYLVPAGKILVIEFASGTATVGPGQGGFFMIVVRDEFGVSRKYAFAGTTLPGGTQVVGSQQMRLYSRGIEGFRNVLVFFFRTGGATGEAGFEASFSGYLVDAP